jgi:pilus assembly protein CpaB
MRARTLILLFFAVILAVGTAMLARTYLAAQRAREATVAQPAVVVPPKSVLVARAEIKRGQILRPDDLTWQVWPEGGLDKNYIISGGPKTPETYTGWVAVNPIGGGEPVTEARIISPGNRGFLAAVLRPGTRAISVPVTVTSGISGFIFPGDQVDMLLTYPFPSPTAADGKPEAYEHKAAETVLRDVRVIGIDQRLESKAGEAFPAHTATFEVTPKQSEVIALASEIGKLSLTLHSLVSEPQSTNGSGDTTPQTSSDSFATAAVTYTVDSEISPLLPKYVSAKGGSESTSVTILRGAAKTSQAISLSKDTGTSGTGEPTKPAGGT